MFSKLYYNFPGIDSRTINCPESISENQLLDLVSELNKDAKVDGILVQVIFL